MRYFLLLLLLCCLIAVRTFGQNVYASASENGTVITTIAEKNEAATVHFFANPVTNVLAVTPSADLNNVFLFVSDVRGRVVAKIMLPHLPGGEEYTYQLNDMSRGIYVFVLQTADQQFSQRIMVQ